MNNNPFQSGIPPSSQIQQKLNAPAIGLIVTGGLNALLAVLELLSGLLRLTRGLQSENIASDAERLGYVAGTFLGYGVGALSLVLSPVIIAGGVALLRGKSLGLVRTAAILAIIPVTSCCFIVGIPVGIWVLMTLKKPEVQEYLSGRSSPLTGPPYR